jgi:hypothetical protein
MPSSYDYNDIKNECLCSCEGFAEIILSAIVIDQVFLDSNVSLVPTGFHSAALSEMSENSTYQARGPL